MATKAYFTEIKKNIIKELNNAQFTIDVAVPWFTDHELFKTLLSKIDDNVVVRLITLNDKINQESGIRFSNIYEKNNKNKVWLIDSNFSKFDSLMHNKFCIIDKKVVINGSFNWTAKASINQESITIHKEEKDITQEFIEQFNRLISLYFGVNDLEHLEYKKLWFYLNNLKNSLLASNSGEFEKYLESLKGLELFISANARKEVLELCDKYKRENYLSVMISVYRINKLIIHEAMNIFYKASQEQKNKNYKKALELYDSALEIKPDLEIAWHKVAEIHAILRDEGKAFDYYQLAKVLNPANFEVLQDFEDYCQFLDGRSYQLDNEKELEEFIFLNPYNFKAHIAYGVKLISNKKYFEAEKVLKNALVINKYNIYPFRLLGELYIELKQFDKSIDYLTKYISVITDDQMAFCFIGYSYNQLDKHKDAIVYLQNAISINPKELNSLIILADSLFKINNFFDAKKYLIMAIEIDKKNEYANELLNEIKSKE